MNYRDQLLALCDAYTAATGRKETWVGYAIQQQTAFFPRLRDQRTQTLYISTFTKAVRWFSDNWPAGASWPEKVPRPPIFRFTEEAPTPEEAA